MKEFLHYLIQFTWALPQNILGFILTRKYRKNRNEKFFTSRVYYHSENWGGISLGMFIVLNGDRDEEWVSTSKVHEYGHTIQSLFLGPLYLLVIGLPSLVWCNAKKYVALRKEKGVSYFDFYPEKWANRLGEKFTHMPAPTR
ncbi:MAG TPA: hypothetical protein PKY53_00565 [Clostridia bacterium]|jgi:hypothetical protein|nr:hypothetical protein [Clostridia bacterium]